MQQQRDVPLLERHQSKQQCQAFQQVLMVTGCAEGRRSRPHCHGPRASLVRRDGESASLNLPALGRCRTINQNEGRAMTEETAQFSEEEAPEQSTPVHSTEEVQNPL